MLDEIPAMKGIEGICVYYNKDQCIRKLKSTEYLTIHRFINNLTIENMLDIYFEIGRPDYKIFEEHIFKTFDFECLSLAKGFISTICDARKEIDKILSHMKSFVENVSTLSRKEAAEKIKSAYGSTVKSGLAFGFLSKKEPDERALKKLFIQIIFRDE
jgi:hypothetical protein